MRATIGAFAVCGALLATIPAAAERPCEVSGWPDNVSWRDTNLSWCPADVTADVRMWSTHAASAHCRGDEEGVIQYCEAVPRMAIGRTDRCACPDDMYPPEMVEAAKAEIAAHRERQKEAARIAEEEIARIASARPCEIPDYPNADPDAVPGLSFSWCPAEVDFQVRSYAIAVAGSHCAKLAGEPGKDWAAQIESLCAGLDNLDDRLASGSHCACPTDIR